MGPRSRDRGNVPDLLGYGVKAGTLQWGRDRVIAETAFGRGPEPRGSVASMGPRSRDRGNTVKNASTY